MLKLGCHVGMSGKDMMLGSVKDAVAFGANTFMLYTGAPQNTRRKDISELKIQEAHELMVQNGIEEFVVHAPYIINLANTVNPATYEIAVEFLAKEIDRATAMGSQTIVLHPGSHVGEGVDKGIASIVKGLNEVLTADTACHIALETMAGKGSEIGRNFEELAAIYEGVRYNDKLEYVSILDHVHDAGYDIVHDFSGVMSQFDKVIGQDQIAVFHVNDSKNPCGAHKDRHENFGFGEIGFEALMQVVNCPDFEQIPKILETPYIPDAENKKKSYAPYKFEIEMIRKGLFDAQLKEKILQAAK